MAKPRVWLSWSSGKDCAFTLHTLKSNPTYDVVGLLTTLNGVADRIAMHGVRSELLLQQAEATGLPVCQVNNENN
jgi:diphthamide synthase (EF-2-diphthine--ammonia ligase)